jgi:hypothetical protein
MLIAQQHRNVSSAYMHKSAVGHSFKKQFETTSKLNEDYDDFNGGDNGNEGYGGDDWLLDDDNFAPNNVGNNNWNEVVYQKSKKNNQNQVQSSLSGTELSFQQIHRFHISSKANSNAVRQQKLDAILAAKATQETDNTSTLQTLGKNRFAQFAVEDDTESDKPSKSKETDNSSKLDRTSTGTFKINRKAHKFEKNPKDKKTKADAKKMLGQLFILGVIDNSSSSDDFFPPISNPNGPTQSKPAKQAATRNKSIPKANKSAVIESEASGSSEAGTNSNAQPNNGSSNANDGSAGPNNNQARSNGGSTNDNDAPNEDDEDPNQFEHPPFVPRPVYPEGTYQCIKVQLTWNKLHESQEHVVNKIVTMVSAIKEVDPGASLSSCKDTSKRTNDVHSVKRMSRSSKLSDFMMTTTITNNKVTKH